VTPIFVRPVREQLEHDRLIRFLQARYKRKFDVAFNVGEQQLGAVRLGANVFYPDIILMTGKKLAGLVEVETVESTNNLEAMAQWTHFSRARVPFHLYVPVLAFDAARRLCDANQVAVSEIWTYRAVNDQFDLVRVFSDPAAVKAGSKLAPKVIMRMPDPPKVEVAPPPPAPVAIAPVPVVAVKAAKAVKSAAPVKPAAPAKLVAPAKPAKPVKAAKPAKAVKKATPKAKPRPAPSRKSKPKTALKKTKNKKRK
jgi:hypothetical protein